jgi:hypothetical protein
MVKKFDLVGAIIDFEAGELRGDKVLELFSHLVKTGRAWSLQGAYGRMAEALIQDNFIDRAGNLLDKAKNY